MKYFDEFFNFNTCNKSNNNPLEKYVKIHLIMVAYSFFHINNILTIKEIMKCTLISMDGFNSLYLMNNKVTFIELLYGKERKN